MIGRLTINYSRCYYIDTIKVHVCTFKCDKSTLFYYTGFVLQVCPNGVVQFESERFNRWPYKFGQRYWLRYDPVLAPYWSNIDLVDSFVNGPSKVFYQIYSDSIPGANTTLSMATADVKKLLSRPLPTNFSASWVLVVTWEKLRPRELTAASQSLVRYVEYSFLGMMQQNV